MKRMGTPPRYRVWSRALAAYLDLARLAQVPVEDVFEDLPFDASSLCGLHFVDWNDFCTLTERLERRCGGAQRCQQLLRQSYHEVVPEFRSLLGSVMSPMSFAKLTLGVISPIVYEGCSFSVTQMGSQRVRVELCLRPGARPSLTFFRATTGELRALPRHLGLEPAVVRASYDDRAGTYDVTLPRSRSVAARARDALDTRRSVDCTFRLNEDGAPVALRVEPRFELGIGARLLAAVQAWALTTRQAEVLRFVVHGAANKEVAQQLGCAENTVELHMTQLLLKARVPSRARLIAHFWTAFGGSGSS